MSIDVIGERPVVVRDRWTVWISVNSARPQGPFSTPMPLHLKPPKGNCGPRARWTLTQAVPASSRPATSVARSVSVPQTDPLRPKWVALARATASSRSR